MSFNVTRLVGAIGLFVCCLALPVRAQDARLRIDHLDRLAERAAEAVEVSLDRAQLQFVRKLARFDRHDRTLRDDRLAKLNSVSVRMFQFEQDGEYAAADVETIRAQLRSPGWEPFDRDSDAFVMRQNGEIIGYAAVHAEARKLCVINVTGQISREDIEELNISDCRRWDGDRRRKR